MKILKIFGLVVGIHVIGFMFVFAIPGCRATTSRHSPPPPAAVQAEKSPGAAAALNAAPPPANAPAYGSSPISPVSDHLTPSTVGASSGYSSAPTNYSAAAAAPVVRFNPTRPGTAEANLLQSGPPPEMTPASSYTVAAGDTLSKIAKKNGLTVKELAAANHLKAEAPLKPGHKLLIPGKATPMSTAHTQTNSATGDTMTYKVKSNDTLQSIAKKAGTTPSNIRALNKLSSDVVRPGQDLILPAGASNASMLASTPTESEPAAAASKSSGPGVHHTVRPNESLDQIAKRYGVTRRDIAVANNITDPKKLRPGQDLFIPGAKSSPNTATAGATPPSSRTNVAPSSPTPEASPASAPANPVSAPIDASPIAPSNNSGSSPVAPPIVPVEENSNPVSSGK